MKIYAHNPRLKSEAQLWETLVAMGVSQPFASGVTTLFNFTDYGSLYSDLALMLEIDSGAANGATLVLDVSEGGVFPNLPLRQQWFAAAASEAQIYSGHPNPNTYYRGQVNNAGVSVSGTWALLGLRRGS